MTLDDSKTGRRGRRVPTWYGHATRRWWALVPWPSAPHGALLIEAPDESTLARYIAQLTEGTAWW